MAQVKEVVGSVSTPELETLSSKIVEKSQNLPDETTTTGNENEESEDFEVAQPSSSQPEKQALLCDKCSECFASKKNLDLHELIVHQNDSQPTTPTKPNLVSTPSEPSEPQCVTTPYALRSNKSTPSCPGSYERMVLQNRKELKEQLEKSNMKNITEEMRKYHTKCAEAAEYGLEKAPPRVVREVPPLSITTRQSAHKTKMVGSLENLEEKGAIAKEAKLAELNEKKQAKAKKLEQSSSRNPFEKLCAQDSVFGLVEKSPPMGMQKSQIDQTPDQANISLDSFCSVSTLSGKTTKIDESISSDDLSLGSDSSSEFESPPKKVKKRQKMPEKKQLSPWLKDENGMPVKAVNPSQNTIESAKKSAQKGAQKSAIKSAKKRAKKSAKKSSNKSANKKLNTKPVQCYECDSVFLANANLKLHFNRSHTKENFDVSKVEHIKYMCYNCPEEFETYSLLEKHFGQKYDPKVLNPKKVYLGDSMKRASVLLKLNLGAPPPSITKNLPKVKKPATPKTKVSLKRVHKFTCYACTYNHTDKENIIQHIIDTHENSENKENLHGKYILQFFRISFHC